MKAWLLDDFKGLGALRLAECPDPVPGPGEVILKVRFAGLNPADRYLAEKLYPLKPALPHILGRDGIGDVVQVGSNVTGVKVGGVRAILRGDVGGTRPGTFAELVAVPSEDLIEQPQGWSQEETAGATLVYLTAYQALTMWGSLPADPVVLVTGATGGVGVASVQLAKAMGCTVVALSRSESKSARLRALGTRPGKDDFHVVPNTPGKDECQLVPNSELLGKDELHLVPNIPKARPSSGADFTFNPSDPDWRKKLKTAIAPRRVDLAIDNIGGTLLPEVIDTLGEQGGVSLVGRLAGPVPSFNTATMFFRRLRMGGVAVGSYSKPEGHAAWREVVRLLREANFKPIVDSVFEFPDLLKAFERLQQGPMGKVLLRGISR